MATKQELENNLKTLEEERGLISIDLQSARAKGENTAAIWEAYNRVQGKIDKLNDDAKKSKGSGGTPQKITYDNQTIIATSCVRRKDSTTLEVKEPKDPIKKHRTETQNLQNQS